MPSHPNRFILAGALLSVLTTVSARPPTCLYVSSYHKGYHWNDGIEAGLEKALGSSCVLQRFYMDTKRNKGPAFATRKAAEAKRIIDELRPEVVIACDDNASRYLVVPHLINTRTPVVFCGVNWTVEAYGYPFPNVTGMIEVAPIRALILQAHDLVPRAKTLGFVSANVPTQLKEVERLSKSAGDVGLQFDHWLVDRYTDWEEKLIEAQEKVDILVLGNPAGIDHWDSDRARRFIPAHTRKLTVSFGLAMSRYAVFSMVNMPEEQGEWSAELAKLILHGHAPSELPITANRRWKVIANPTLARSVGISLPESILQGAEIVDTRRP